MGIFTTSTAVVACKSSGQAIGTASHRLYPPRLDVHDNTKSLADNERAGRILQRLDEGFLDIPAERAAALRSWLSNNSLELTYRFMCPSHGVEWASAPDIARAMRRNRGTSAWVKVDTH